MGLPHNVSGASLGHGWQIMLSNSYPVSPRLCPSLALTDMTGPWPRLLRFSGAAFRPETEKIHDCSQDAPATEFQKSLVQCSNFKGQECPCVYNNIFLR